MMSFVHHVLQARDPSRAQTFYRELLGWEIGEGGRCLVGGREVAVITRSTAPAPVPSHWLPFLGVDDVDAAVAQALKHGGQVRRHALAREAIIVDPRGAAFGLRSDGKDSGVFAWNELLTDDCDAASHFYAALGGFEIDKVDLGAVGTYHLLRRGIRRVAGMMKHPANVRPHWQVYLAVDDVDAVTERAIALGATLYFAPSDQRDFGRWSAVDDPVGAGVCFLRPERGTG